MQTSTRLRFHCQTAGSSVTAVQPLNNIVRTACQALAAVLRGCQSLQTNGVDEALAIHSEEAMKLARRTQQILLEETGVAHSIDPLGGSYLLGVLTDQTERGILEYLGPTYQRAKTRARRHSASSGAPDAPFQEIERRLPRRLDSLPIVPARDRPAPLLCHNRLISHPRMVERSPGKHTTARQLDFALGLLWKPKNHLGKARRAPGEGESRQECTC